MSAILEVIRQRPRLLNLLPVLPVLARAFAYHAEITKPELRQLAERFKMGIAQALGVPPEYINEEIIERWAIHWARAFVKPEYWRELGLI